ncbi:MAG: RluA family pseudouridine synthase [Mariprofundaceae bacterium]
MSDWEDRRGRAGAAEDGLRLDQALAQVFGISRRAARQAIDLGGAWIGHRRCRVAGRRVRQGDALRLVRLLGERHVPLDAAQILWHHGPLLALAKHAGQYAQPALHRSKGCLPDEVGRLFAGEWPGPWQPVHRLDRGTSGVMLLCADKVMHERIQRHWRTSARKRYLAVVEPSPGWDERLIRLAIGRKRDALGRFRPDPEGRPSFTRARVLERSDARALIALAPETGRTHQLRVHLAALGCPILGDSRYGGRPHHRMMLHAEHLALAPPALDAAQEWRAPLEEDWSW